MMKGRVEPIRCNYWQIEELKKKNRTTRTDGLSSTFMAAQNAFDLFRLFALSRRLHHLLDLQSDGFEMNSTEDFRPHFIATAQ